MTRRDTIILAVLINAGLLILLFATATSDRLDTIKGSSQQIAVNVDSQKIPNPDPESPSKAAEEDDVDLLLNQLSARSSNTHPNIASLPQTATVSSDVGVKPLPSANLEIASTVTSVAPTNVSPTNIAPTSAVASIPVAVKANTTTPPVALNSKIATTQLDNVVVSPVIASNVKPAQEVVASATPSADYLTVTVKRGDILDRIAKNNGVSVKQIMDLNHLKDVHLQVGQSLMIPKGSVKSEVTTVAATSSQEVNSKLYVVKKGDSAWAIAARHKMTVDELMKLNGFDQERARRIKPGDKLKVQD